MKSKIYNHAKYYEIAFDFMDIPKQIDLFESFVKKYSLTPVKKVLDIACGPSLQLREMARRGYHTIGLDSSPHMLNYLTSESQKESLLIKTIQADMIHFSINEKVDFAYNLMGSIIYVRSNHGFLQHLDSVAKSLKRGGLYLIENMPMNWMDNRYFKPQTWQVKRNAIKIKTTYHLTIKNALEQVVTQTIMLDVHDNGKRVKYVDRNDLKLIFPQELISLITLNGKFEFLGFFERQTTKILTNCNSNNIVLLRRIGLRR